jgi:hypothetical protein
MMQGNVAVSDKYFDTYTPVSVVSDYSQSSLSYSGEIEELTIASRKARDTLLAQLALRRAERTAGEDSTTIYELEHARARAALIRLLERHEFQGLSYDSGSCGEMNPDTVRFARKLLSQLKSKHMLPRIAPDGEGDLMMVWDNPPTLLVTVEGKALHAVLHPGSPRSRHIPPVEFVGEAVPGEIAAFIPKP